MSHKKGRSLTALAFSFSFRSKAKQNQILDEASQKTRDAADALLKKGDLSTAEVIIKTLIKKYSHNADCYWLFGRLCAGKQRYDSAVSKFKKALKLAPSHAECLCSYAEVLYITKKYHDAEEMYLQCLVSNARYHRCHFSYAQLLQMVKSDLIEAEKHYITAIELSKNDPCGAYYQAYAQLLSSSSRNEEAREQFEKAVAIDTDNHEAHFLFAKCLVNMGKITLALSNTKTAIKLNPKKEYLKYLHDLNLIKSKKNIHLANQSVDFLKLPYMKRQKPIKKTNEKIFDGVLNDNAASDAVDNPLTDILLASKDYRPVVKDSRSVRDLVQFVKETKGGEEEEKEEEAPQEWWSTGSGHGTKFEVQQMYGDKDEFFHEILASAEQDVKSNEDIICNPTDEPEEEDSENRIASVNSEEKDTFVDPFSDLVSNANSKMKRKDKNVEEHDGDKEDKKMMEVYACAPTDEVINDAPMKQLYIFLKECRLEQYYDLLINDDCVDDIRDIEYVDEEFFVNISMKKIHKRRLIRECEKFKKQMDAFRKQIKMNGIPKIFVGKLSEFGIVTMDILCKEVQNKSDLKDKFDIVNDRHCELLWIMIKKYLYPQMDSSHIIAQDNNAEDVAEMVQQEGVIAHVNVMDTSRFG